MTSLKVLSVAAAVALMLPLAAPTESFAQLGSKLGGGGGGGAAIGGGGVGGGGGGVRAGGGGGGVRAGGGGGFVAGGAGSKIGGGYVGGGGPRYSGGGNWQGRGGYHHRHRHHRHRGFFPGFAIGGLLGSSYAYYGAADPYYYDDGYYDEGVVAVVPGDDSIEYCKRRFRSYDVRSRTYLGFDGQRHPCP